MASEENIWPSSPILISQAVKTLITRFFTISDSPDLTSGRLFADECFTANGVFKTHETCVFRGREEIAASRETNHPAIASRSHRLFRVYAANSPATELVVLGRFEIWLKDGTGVGLDFTARFVVADTANPEQGIEEENSKREVRFSYVQAWTDPTEMIKAFQRASENLGLGVNTRV